MKITWDELGLRESVPITPIVNSVPNHSGEIKYSEWLEYFWFFVIYEDPEDAYSLDWVQDRQDKRVSEFLGGPGKRVSEFLGGPGKRVSEFLGGPGKRVSEFLGGPGKRLSEFLGGPGKRYPAGNNMHQALSKRVSEFLGGPGKRSDYYDFMENAEKR
ncbi:hypothetical protein AVEN_235031-1 [Araneus ventricosus]|uniref:Uncharacterized protein n=1 Tax=Araneus ventricosus TaxID=182803 RepID=A0A4Y2KVR5_ARAVE|nr:hypothetical protein AVEN_235031-1 [Araneus ventricosus]